MQYSIQQVHLPQQVLVADNLAQQYKAAWVDHTNSGDGSRLCYIS
jgi:hypothetical protein